MDLLYVVDLAGEDFMGVVVEESVSVSTKANLSQCMQREGHY